MGASRRLKILVVEDDEGWRDVLLQMLKPDHEVFGAKDGAEGVRLALQQLPDLILCDLNMPNMTGEEVLRHLAADAALFSVPVILMTAQQLDAAKKDQLRRSPNVRGLLMKPCALEDVKKAVDYVISLPGRFAPGSAPPGGKKRFKILLVDDNYTFAQVLAMVLNPDDQLTHAEDGIEAWTQMKAMKPDLVIADMMMPRMSGMELLRAMQKEAAYRTMPVILVTGTNLRPEQVQFMYKDFPNLRQVVQKPCSVADLRKAIEGAVTRDLA